jgi:ribosomal protein S18 acetylase RimI-like enzyme
MSKEINLEVSITPERPDSAEAIALIEELETHLAALYPQESRHGYSVEKLIREGVAFFLIRVNGEAVGCGGVQLFATGYGEIKRMYVRPTYQGMGLARAMLERLAAHAMSNGVDVLRLETGIHQSAAITLYKHWGFEIIPPFGNYREDPLSIFFEKRLTSTEEEI